MELSQDHSARLDDILRWRRDVRHFNTRPVEPDVLARIEASVDFAPSVGNSRPWRVVRVMDEDKRRAVCDSFERENLAASRAYRDDTRCEYLALKLAGLREAPVHYAFFCDPDPAEGRGLGRRTMPQTLAYSTVMAIHTLWLAARARNIGVGWVSILNPAIMNETLEVPCEWTFIAYLCVGYPVERRDVPELHMRGWQENCSTVWIDR
ncbi:5,6-dimethylbenzimidazole synthase [Hoeflea poritis]|uniref:5,6-dimethylbenzimidazole synthase n=1 Tax=Hoeflea poritis TaxID=2993659 RepID=A0ABT4VPT3_9HYPH|nr:5,6-dimethylbenzimidazole synthase [Hoeflea poritis]MDA4846082.1 5,6-dimethylbenzimidazole synthase [Hoeflea poritis]